MHFFESTILMTKDGIICQVYGNQHPEGKVLVKPKYIPTDKISCDDLPYRFISGQRMNRLNLWIGPEKLKKYIESFKEAYPQYVYTSEVHDQSPLLFVVSKEDIEREYSPKKGLSDLMSMPNKDLDGHLKVVVNFAKFLLESPLDIEDLGVTYSTLMGHYSPNISDINIVVYGKEKFWELMKYLQKAEHPDLRWKTYDEWESFYKKRNRHMIHEKNIYIENMDKKRSEGFFSNTLFVIFAVENEEESWFTWGKEKYTRTGSATFKASIVNEKDSVVRPGCYAIKDSTFIAGDEECKDIPITKIVFFSRDYCMLAYSGEEVEVSGVIEKVEDSTNSYYRIVVGYFDSYISEKRDEEYIKVVK